MFIHFKILRSKNNDVIDEGKLQFNITKDEYLITLDDIIVKLLTDYINDLPQVKSYGIAYVGQTVVPYIEITNDDTAIDFNREEFAKYFSNLNMNQDMKVIWSKDVKITEG